MEISKRTFIKEYEEVRVEELRWDLTELYPGPESPEIEADMKRARKLAQEFEKNYRGKINDPNLTADFLAQALTEFEEIHQIWWKLDAYAYLLFTLNTQDSIARALTDKVKEVEVFVNKRLLLLELEWRQLPEVVASKLIADPKLSHWRHFLERGWFLVPHTRPHTLSEPEEKILMEKSVIADAWAKHFERIGGRIQVSGRPLVQVLSELHSPDREHRRRFQQKIADALKAEADSIIDIFNAKTLDHVIDLRLRNYQDPMAPRNLEEEVSAATVEALLITCEENTDIVARYYRLKRRLLGLKRLYSYDLYAPLPFREDRKFHLSEARDLLITSCSDFSPELGRIANLIFKNGWIDTSEGKAGSFNVAVPFLHPFLSMIWTGTRRDVLAQAHEGGHAIQAYSHAPLSLLQTHPGATLAEMGSTFVEQLVFERWKAQISDPKERLALLCGYLDDRILTIFRQAALTRFEQKLYEARAEKELSIEQLNELWRETQSVMFQDSVTMPKDYGCGWSSISHFICWRPFYCYSYAFGNLLVLSLYRRYQEEGKAFVPKYHDLLAAGGSDSPANRLKPFEADIENPDFWKEGMEILRETVEEAEASAQELGY